MSATQPKLANSVVHGCTKTRWKSNGGMRFISSRFPVASKFDRPLRRRRATLHVRKAWDWTAVRVVCGVGQTAFQFAHYFVAEHVLNLFCVLMDVVGGDLRGVRQVEFPEAVIADDGASQLPARRSHRDGIAFVVRRRQAVPAQLCRLRGDFLDGFAAPFGQFAEGDTLALEVAGFEHLVNGLERILALDAQDPRALPQ